ncbi:hypothetical protein U6A24_22340 [Aquimarina gracilis]|uniref:Uncharacterized protein n=1 Tax=Aquimarina gracilis TaxID=874422 RepID=A0ABU6A232_9FLAO|nr:hypothetical protein [Aquimarina gracilis]MEB3348234.1 hypothetical protein [Aquimarina gracilis]
MRLAFFVSFFGDGKKKVKVKKVSPRVLAVLPDPNKVVRGIKITARSTYTGGSDYQKGKAKRYQGNSNHLFLDRHPSVYQK